MWAFRMDTPHPLHHPNPPPKVKHASTADRRGRLRGRFPAVARWQRRSTIAVALFHLGAVSDRTHRQTDRSDRLPDRQTDGTEPRCPAQLWSVFWDTVDRSLKRGGGFGSQNPHWMRETPVPKDSRIKKTFGGVGELVLERAAGVPPLSLSLSTSPE